MEGEDKIHLEALLEGAIEAHEGYFTFEESEGMPVAKYLVGGCHGDLASCNCDLAKGIRWAQAELGLR